MMWKAIQSDSKTQAFKRITNLDDLQAAGQDSTAITWLDLHNPTEESLTKVGAAFHLHPLAIEDATHEHQRPKIEEYEHFFFLVFYTVTCNEETGELEVSELDMFMGQNYLITVHEQYLPELEEVEQRWTRNSKHFEWGIGSLLYALLDTIVDRYFPIVDRLVDRAEDLEDRLFLGTARQVHLTQTILELKKDFLTLRRIAAPERDVLNMLTNRDNPLFDDHVLIYFRDVYDHITRLADTIDLYRDQLTSIMDAHLSIVSNDLNKVMRTLTAASIILMADALIAGIYGMNFENIPELKLPWGYFACLGLIAGLTMFLFFVFKRLKWF
ncbi:MAG: magnesium/cobalt transporter CorA [Ktedonobacteraceae bacterium]|nr:magnesium/cobalt transporter CorA [Ktedonobacteraceae bacterium]